MKKEVKMVKVPILDNSELVRLGEIMHQKSSPEEMETFWDEVYKSVGLGGCDLSNRLALVEEFNKMVAIGTLRLSLTVDMDPLDLSDEEKIQVMEAINSVDPSKGEEN